MQEVLTLLLVSLSPLLLDSPDHHQTSSRSLIPGTPPSPLLLAPCVSPILHSSGLSPCSSFWITLPPLVVLPQPRSPGQSSQPNSRFVLSLASALHLVSNAHDQTSPLYPPPAALSLQLMATVLPCEWSPDPTLICELSLFGTFRVLPGHPMGTAFRTYPEMNHFSHLYYCNSKQRPPTFQSP